MKTKKALYDTLVKAKEHLEYCGYGGASNSFNGF